MPESLTTQGFSKSSFLLAKNGQDLQETTTIETLRPRQKKIDLSRPEHQALLLERFLNVRKPMDVLKYAKDYGVPLRREMAIVHEHDMDLSRPGHRRFIVRSTWPFLYHAATLRWLLALIQVIQNSDHDQLSIWIKKKTALQSRSLFSSVSPEPAWQLYFEMTEKTDEYDNWIQSENVFSKNHKYRVTKQKFQRSEIKARMDYAKAYVSFHLSDQISRVHPAVMPDGKPYYQIASQFEAMCMLLCSQFSGAAGIAICRNPNCATRFYSVAKSNRQPRLDKRYCGDTCQKWGRKYLGKVRGQNDEK